MRYIRVLAGAFFLMVFLFPLSQVQAAEIKDLRGYFDQADQKGGSWYKGCDNDSGYLAFREAYILQSYLLMYEAYLDTCYLDKFIDHADSVLSQRDSVRKVTDYRGLSLPAWRYTDPPDDTNPQVLGGKYYHVAVQTGSLSYPYAWFAQIVKSDSGLSGYKSKAAEYVQAAKDALGVHEDEWRESAATGYYIFRKGSPYWCDGVGVPFNHNLSLARTMIRIYQATGETKYMDRAAKIARHFKNNLTLNSDHYVWNYWWGPGYEGWYEGWRISANTPSYKGYKKQEDFRHGSIDADFVSIAHDAGIVFTDKDMELFANTVEKSLLRPDGKINEFVSGAPVDGQYGILIGLWLRHHELAPSLPEAAYRYVSGSDSIGPPGLLVLAYLNWACMAEGKDESLMYRPLLMIPQEMLIESAGRECPAVGEDPAASARG